MRFAQEGVRVKLISGLGARVVLEGEELVIEVDGGFRVRMGHALTMCFEGMGVWKFRVVEAHPFFEPGMLVEIQNKDGYLQFQDKTGYWVNASYLRHMRFAGI